MWLIVNITTVPLQLHLWLFVDQKQTLSCFQYLPGTGYFPELHIVKELQEQVIGEHLIQDQKLVSVFVVGTASKGRSESQGEPVHFLHQRRMFVSVSSFLMPFIALISCSSIIILLYFLKAKHTARLGEAKKVYLCFFCFKWYAPSAVRTH